MGLIRNLVIFGLVLFFFAVIAVSFDLGYTGNIVRENFTTQYAVENPSEIVGEYNQRFENLPNFARTLLGNEKINLIINMEDGSIKNFAFMTKNGKIVSYQTWLFSEPTIVVTTSEGVIDSISKSPKPVEDFANAIKDGSIKLEPKSFFGGAKLYTAKLVIKIKNVF